MSSQLDLSQLAVERSSPRPPARGAVKKFAARWLAPLAILLAFVGLLARSAGQSVLPAKAVTVVPVAMARADAQQEGAPLFQAAGWIEPRPASLIVSSLAPGVIERLFVVEGDRVEAGQPLAKLIDVDARLALQEAEAEYQLREAELTAAQAERDAAKALVDRPLSVNVAVAEAEYRLAQVETELTALPFDLQTSKAQQTFADKILSNDRLAKASVPGKVVWEAETNAAIAAARVEQLTSRRPALELQRKALVQKRDALMQQREDLPEHRRRLTEADAQVSAAAARCRKAQIAVDAAKLQLQRMTVRSPIAGKVLSLDSQPGKRLAGLSPHSVQDASAVVTLYDPQVMQVRVDVRLEDVPHVQPGQPVSIETASVSKPLVGRVLACTSQADIQKNTLQVKATIDNPPDVIAPEMLAQVTFLAPPPGKSTEAEETPLRILVPRELVIAGDGDQAFVWVADRESKQARRQAVQLGRAGTEELIEVASGLTPLDKLIVAGREGLQPDERVFIAREESPDRR